MNKLKIQIHTAENTGILFFAFFINIFVIVKCVLQKFNNKFGNPKKSSLNV